MLRIFRSRTDLEHIEGLAKTIRFWDRWRPLILIVFVTLLALLVGVVGWGMNLLVGLQPNALGANLNLISVVAAFFIGATFGLHFCGIMYYVIPAAVGGYRTERLLVKLYTDSMKSQTGEQDRRAI